MLLHQIAFRRGTLLAALLLIFLLSEPLQAGCITKDGVLLKSRLGKKAPTSWQVRRYTPFKRLGEPYNGWVHVRDFEGEKHWVQQKFFTEKYHCLIVRKDSTPIMVAPKKRSNQKFKQLAEKYETFKFLKVKKGWVQIKDVHGDTGWVLLSDVWLD